MILLHINEANKIINDRRARFHKGRDKSTFTPPWKAARFLFNSFSIFFLISTIENDTIPSRQVSSIRWKVKRCFATKVIGGYLPIRKNDTNSQLFFKQSASQMMTDIGGIVSHI